MTLHLDDFRVEAVIGILPEERTGPQEIRIGLQADYDYKKGFLDYVPVRDTVRSMLQTKKYGLLEEALIDITHALGRNFPQLKKVNLKLSKPGILSDAAAGVSLEKEFN